MDEKSRPRSVLRIQDYKPDASVLALLPLDFIKAKHIVPLQNMRGRLLVAVPSKDSQVKPEGVAMLAGMPVDFLPSTIEEIEKFIQDYYMSKPVEEESKLDLVVGGPVPSLLDKHNLNEVVSTPGLTLTDTFQRVMLDACLNRATEVLMSLKDDTVQFRERIRGNLVNAGLHFRLEVGDVEKFFEWLKKVGASQSREEVKWVTWSRELKVKNEQFHISALLTQAAASQHLSIRIGQRKEKVFSPTSWGMDPAQARIFSDLLARGQGLLLFCGSEHHNIDDVFVASGNMMATPNRHVIAVEDGPQTWTAGIDSFVANGHQARFQEYLRQAFQHNPDVVMVNPLAGKDYIDVCLREAVKGRFIVARMFATDTADVLMQLFMQHIEPYLIGAGVSGIVSKKTLRLNCAHCQVADANARVLAKELGIPLGMQPVSFYKGKGCHHCEHSGFDGETDIFEVFPMDDDLRVLFKDNLKVDLIRTALKTKGLPTFRQIAIHKAINGQISLSEIVRATSK